MIFFWVLPVIGSFREMTLEGDQFCSYRAKSEIFRGDSSDKIELEKGFECEVCSSQQECKSFKEKLLTFPNPEDAPTGRISPLQISDFHFVLGTRLKPPFPSHLTMAIFGMGCF